VRKRAVILATVATLLVLAAVGAFPLYLHYFRYPPAPARALPQNADAYIYVDLRPIRTVAGLAPGSLIPESDVLSFSAATGIIPERDIDEVAVAVFAGPKSPTGEATYRSAEVVTGRFDRSRLRAFLERAGQRISYRDYEVFEVPREDRTVRVTVLDDHSVAVSNLSGAQTINAMIDRSQHLGFPRSGPYRMNEAFKRVPFGAIAWGTVHIANRSESGFNELPMWGSRLSLPAGTEVIFSACVLSSLEFRAETLLGSQRDAEKLSDQIATYLTLFRAIELAMPTGGADPDAKKLFESLRIEREGMKVQVKAEVPFSFVAKLARENQLQPPAQRREDAENGQDKSK
jgi:hypothetical protein